MEVTVVCFGLLRDYLPDGSGGRTSVELPEGSTVEGLSEVLGIPSRHVYAVLVNGEQTERSTALTEGVEVTLMPPYSGGS